MCKENISNPIEFNEARAEVLLNRFPEHADFIKKISKIMTENLNSHYQFGTLLTLMYDRVVKGVEGLYSSQGFLRIPLTILGFKNGLPHRWRDNTLQDLHDAVLSSNMSEGLMSKIRELFVSDYNLRLVMSCSCGVILGNNTDVVMAEARGFVRKLDLIRSEADCLGIPVERVSLDNLNNDKNMDLSDVEYSILKELHDICEEMEKIGSTLSIDKYAPKLRLFIPQKVENKIRVGV